MAGTVNMKEAVSWRSGLLGLFPDLLELGNSSGSSSLMMKETRRCSRTDPEFRHPRGSRHSRPTGAAVQILLSVAYSVVRALGLVGNLLVLNQMKRKQGFVTSPALTDFQFVPALPFWAVENALDFTWPFGKAMRTMTFTVRAGSMYASVFLLATIQWPLLSRATDRED